MRIVGWIVVIFVGLIVIAGVLNDMNDPHRERWVSDCAKERATINRMLPSWQSLGVVVDWSPEIGKMTVRVEDAAWRAAPHDGKESIGLAAYCLVIDSHGRGNAFIEGYRSGKILASVIDGNYFD